MDGTDSVDLAIVEVVDGPPVEVVDVDITVVEAIGVSIVEIIGGVVVEGVGVDVPCIFSCQVSGGLAVSDTFFCLGLARFGVDCFGAACLGADCFGADCWVVFLLFRDDSVVGRLVRVLLLLLSF